jgi:hypothetical protein
LAIKVVMNAVFGLYFAFHWMVVTETPYRVLHALAAETLQRQLKSVNNEGTLIVEQ